MEGLGCWTSEVESNNPGLFSDQLTPKGFPTLSLLGLLDERRAYWTALCCWVEGQKAPVLDLLCLDGQPGAAGSGLPSAGKRGDSRSFGAGVQEDPTPPSHLVCGGRCIGLLRFCCYCCGQIKPASVSR